MKSNTKNIIPSGKQLPMPLDNDKGNLPQIWVKTCRTLHQLNPYLIKEVILQAVIVKTAQMFTSKRITCDLSGEKRIPNWFTVIIGESGGGKDRLIDYIDKFILPPFKNWCKENVITTDKTGNKKNEICTELEDATPQGIYELARTLKATISGSIFIKMPELAYYIKNATRTDLKFLSNLCKYYDCKVPRTFTKSYGFSEEIIDIAINMLAYTDDTLFRTSTSNINHIFNPMMMSGIGRRCSFSIQPRQKFVCTTFTDEEETRIINDLIACGNELFKIFENIPLNGNYKVLPDTKLILNGYKEQIANLFNQTKNELLKLEIRDRVLKSRILSCLIACLYHPTETVIKTVDMQQAINTVEFLSSGLEKFLQINPECNDKDFKAFKFLETNINRGFSRTALINELCKHCGYTRRGLNAYFNATDSNSFTTNMTDIANYYGYKFVADSEKYSNGTYYYLRRNNNPTTPLIVPVDSEDSQ